MNDVLSEFLSCVSLSDQAFVDLCDYFRTVDRKVIVCMLGDHSPSFVEDITTKELGDRKEIAQATVPLVIWANFDLELTGELPERSVTAVAPLLVSLAGARNSPYFQYILNLSQSCPVNRYTYRYQCPRPGSNPHQWPGGCAGDLELFLPGTQ